MMNRRWEACFTKIKNRETEAVFVGDEEIRDYLCYVLGDFCSMRCISYQVFQVEDRDEQVLYIVDNASRSAQCLELQSTESNVIWLTDFVNVLNNMAGAACDRPIALWGAGSDLEQRFDRLLKNAAPKVIIDNNRKGTYLGTPIVSPENVDIHSYFIIITTTKYAREVQSILEAHGCRIGQDYVFGIGSGFENDLAEMFLKTISDEPLQKVQCSQPFEYISIDVGGCIRHCCTPWMPWIVGNVFDSASSSDSIASRIIRVSFMNNTYSFCNTLLCSKMKKKRKNLVQNKGESTTNRDFYLKKQQLKHINIAFDDTCNLYCESCRNHLRIDKSVLPMVVARKAKDFVKTAEYILIAGNGEVFLSKAYQYLLEGSYPDTVLGILTNGNLFSEKAWKLIEGNFQKIYIIFSVDAASKSTYEKVRRGGKWERVLNGLRLASALRTEGKIDRFVIRFVVSARNYMEMKDFIRLGMDLHCDCVEFSRLENWGTFTDEEFERMSMFHGEEPKPELKEVLDDPIFMHPIVNFFNMQP